MFLSNETIAAVLRVPKENVDAYVPLIEEALIEQGINTPLVQVAALGTVKVETGRFSPLQELRASPNRQPELYAAQNRYWSSGYFGRGFIQLTWEQNYRDYGKALGLDLLGQPDLAKDPKVAARVLALYFKRMHVDAAAEAQDWTKVRKLVNGGTNGLQIFMSAVNGLMKAAAGVSV